MMIFRLSKHFQHLRRIFRRFYLVHGFDDDSFFVDQVRRADDSHGDFPVVLLFLPDIVGLQHVLFRVREQDEGEIADTIDEENANDTEDQDSEQGSQTPRAIAVAVILAIITLTGLFSFRYYMLAQIPDPSSVYRIHAWSGQTESPKKRR